MNSLRKFRHEQGNDDDTNNWPAQQEGWCGPKLLQKGRKLANTMVEGYFGRYYTSTSTYILDGNTQCVGIEGKLPCQIGSTHSMVNTTCSGGQPTLQYMILKVTI